MVFGFVLIGFCSFPKFEIDFQFWGEEEDEDERNTPPNRPVLPQYSIGVENGVYGFELVDEGLNSSGPAAATAARQEGAQQPQVRTLNTLEKK